MRSSKRVVIVAVVTLVAAAAVAESRSRSAAAPAVTPSQPAPLNPVTPIPFHGQLTDSSGSPINTQVTLIFALYKSATSTSVYWSEQHSLTPQGGWFSVVLGDVSSGGTVFPNSWDGTELWLGITVQGDTEMTPRTPLLPVPYAAIANPTQHGFTHALGGTDEIGANISTPNELVRGNVSGVIDPGWLPAASAGSPGVVQVAATGGSSSQAGATPVANSSGKLDPSFLPGATNSSYGAVEVSSTGAAGEVPVGNGSGKIDPSWLPNASSSSYGAVEAASVGTAGEVPVGNGSGKIDPSWLPNASSSSYGAVETASIGANGEVPVGNGSGKIDASWLPTATSSSYGAVQASSVGNNGEVPVGNGSGKLDPSWLPAATATAQGAVTASTTSTAGAVPVANGSGQIASQWLPTVPISNGGTGTSSPTITRNLCIYVAGPVGSGSNVPTLMLPPDLSNCSAVRMFASANSAPSGTLLFSFSRYAGGTGSGTLFSPTATWNTSSLSVVQPFSSPVAMNAGDIIYANWANGTVANATVCLQVACNYQFQ